uniref:cytochrome b n=1 Tax=Sacculina confragosa TaxID=238040 RepID=UPI002551F1A2|nr:cytochrome b [Sacculina confragosa]WGU20865.1 cytochrome b [Sacculina confragosa]
MLLSLMNNPTPSNLSYLWNFGSLLGVNFFFQLFSGFIISFYYCSDSLLAFSSVVHIMMDVNGGWFLRYLHMNGASMFFVLIYLHIGRGLYYGSYMNLNLWVSGFMLLLLLFGIAFLGYVLPWGQMSFWGATVITSLITAIPYIGVSLTEWIWGGYSAGYATLIRFFSLHFILPFLMACFVIFHLFLLHNKGSNSSLFYNMNLDKISFHPYFTYKDILGFSWYFGVFILVICLFPNFLGDSENYIPANSMVTPVHIKPEWYYLFAYAILRSVSNKLGGVLALLFSIFVIVMLPLMDNSDFFSMKFYFFSKFFYWIQICNFFFLTWLGGLGVEPLYINLSTLLTFNYFFCYFIITKKLG